MNKTFIYRLYHKYTGSLMYVGISCDPERRFKEHKKSIFKDVPLYQEIGDCFDDRNDALICEKEIIEKEHPIENIKGGHGQHTIRQKIKYPAKPKIKGKNVTITNLNDEHYNKLVGLAGQKNMSITAYFKHMLESIKFNEEEQRYCSSSEGFWG